MIEEPYPQTPDEARDVVRRWAEKAPEGVDSTTPAPDGLTFGHVILALAVLEDARQR